MCISGYVINPEEVRPAQRYLMFLRAQKATPPIKPRPLDYLDVAASILVKNWKWFKNILSRDNNMPILCRDNYGPCALSQKKGQDEINNHTKSPYIRVIKQNRVGGMYSAKNLDMAIRFSL